MGELLTNHHGVEVEVVESMEMAPGVNPRPGREPEQDLLTPKLGFDGGGAAELFVEDDRWFWVFPKEGIYRQKGKVGGGPRPQIGRAHV